MQGAETLSPFGVPHRGLGRPRVRPEGEQPSSARELGSRLTPTPVDRRTASELAGQLVLAARGLPVGTRGDGTVAAPTPVAGGTGPFLEQSG